MLLRSLAICLLLAGSLAAQTIGGLSTVQVGVDSRFPVSGLNAPSGSFDELAKWAAKLIVHADAPTGSQFSIEADIGLVRRQPVLYFSADRPGLYVLCLADTGAAVPTIVTKRILVIGTSPTPTPDPTPDPPIPTPPEPPQPVVTTGQRLIFLVREISNNTPAIVMAEFSLRRGPEAAYLNGKNHQLIALSDDLGVPPNTPAAFKSAIEKAAKIGSPTLVICDPSKPTAAGVLATVPFTAPASTIIPLLQKYGG
jgi:hypothetical protein